MGESVPSRYRVVGKIGTGGMGVVVHAEDTTLRRSVALKLLKGEPSAREELRARFLREARAAASLNHPSICTIYEVGEVEPGAVVGGAADEEPIPVGTPYIAMELVEGETLRAAFERSGSLPLQDLLDVALQVAEGLAEAHVRGVVHRDLKPQNVMVTPKGRVKILDFGLAKILDPRKAGDELQTAAETYSATMTREGRILGTVGYMSPEQAMGKPVDWRSDIFSFGTMLYEMATGREPFRGETATSTLAKILETEPEPLSALKPDLPADLERIVLRCLRKKPEDRYDDARELVADLRSLPQPINLPPRNRRRRVAAAAGLSAVALLVLLIGPSMRGWRERLFGEVTSAGIRSLAVLPLANFSGDPEQEYFSDGMTEALTAELSKIGALQVTSRTSAMGYKGSRKSLPEIARELGVDTVVEGSVLRSGDRVRIAVQLIDAPKDRHVWAESYERELRNVLTLQGEVARAVAREIRISLTPQENDRLVRARPLDPEAYHLYLKGRYCWNKRTEEGLKKGLEYFQQAIEQDPDYAPAYAGVADSYFVLASWDLLPPDEAYPKAKAAAHKALKIDDNLAEAHASLGAVRMDYELDWAGAEKEYRRALELNPSYAPARQWYAIHLAATGRFDESIPEIERAQQLDPLSPIINATVGRHYYFARRYDEAIQHYRKALEMEPNFTATHYFLGLAYEEKAMYDDAIAELQRALSPSADGPRNFLLAIVHAYALSGRKNEAREMLRRLENPVEGLASLNEIAVIYAALGEKDRAFESLEKAYRQEKTSLLFLKVDPRFDPLRSDPHFADLLRRIGLPP